MCASCRAVCMCASRCAVCSQTHQLMVMSGTTQWGIHMCSCLCTHVLRKTCLPCLHLNFASAAFRPP